MLLLKKMMKYLVHTEILGCQKKKEKSTNSEMQYIPTTHLDERKQKC